MEGKGKGGKLSRTQSCILRSSPTIRSSIHSLSSMSMTQVVSVSDWEQEEEEEEKKQASSSSSSSGVGLIWMVTLSVGSLTLILTYMYLKTPPLIVISASENLLFALIFIALALFYLGKNRHLLERSKSIIYNCYLYNKYNKHNRNGSKSNSSSSSVHWCIGDEDEARQDVASPTRAVSVSVYSNGDLYEGEFHKGKCNGSGVYNYFVNGRYEGDWVDGRYDGYGIESWARGSKYRGQYSAGLRHGFGVYTFYTGDTYAGQWFHGQYHGLGLQTCSDASSYHGYFNFGLKHGLGSYYFRNGDRYAGEYFGDKIHGFGVYHFANGHCYEGSWHEGRKQGFGMYTFRNGEPKCGEWDAGSLKTPLPPLTHSVLRAVQAARKAAENAINLGRVDEQVNKAVMAANRAATAARVAAVKAVQNRMDGKLYDTSYV